jgi:hypothetical protein
MTFAAATVAAGDTWSFGVTAAQTTLQLTEGGSNVGSSVTVHKGDTSAVVGDSNLDQTVNLSFDYSHLGATAATASGPSANHNVAATRLQSHRLAKKPFTAYCPLPTAHCLLPPAFCFLPSASYLLLSSITNYQLPVTLLFLPSPLHLRHCRHHLTPHHLERLDLRHVRH